MPPADLCQNNRSSNLTFLVSNNTPSTQITSMNGEKLDVGSYPTSNKEKDHSSVFPISTAASSSADTGSNQSGSATLFEKVHPSKVREYFLVSHSGRIYSRVKQAHRSVENERIRHLQTYPSTIHPYSDFRWSWDIFMAFFIMIALVGQPLQIAFYAHSMEIRAGAIIALGISLVFFMDMVLNFRTGYVGNENDDVILVPSKIAMQYVKTWFLVDLIATIPFDSIYFLINDGQVYFSYVRLLELLKILRLARVIRYLSRIERAYEIRTLNSRIINLLTMILFLIHWLGCMHFLVAHMSNSYPYSRKDASWVSQMKLWDRPIWEKYVHCMLRALSNMACLGYGFITPNAPEDVIATLTAIMIGATCFAMFIASMASIVLNLDTPQKNYTEWLNQTIDYMNFKRVPKSLQRDVIVYFEQRYRRNLFNEDEIFANLSDCLRQRIKMSNCQRLIEQAPLFQGISKEILHGIVTQLKFELYLPKDVIISENTIGTCMFFIENGTVQVLGSNGETLNLLQDGNFFGEVSLVTNERRRATVIATTVCEVYRLEKQDFEKVILQYPEIYTNIVKVANERHDLLNQTPM